MAKLLQLLESDCTLTRDQLASMTGMTVEEVEAAIKRYEDEKIILDPGIGFGKTYGQNLEMLNRLELLRKLGYPVLLGTSRKSVIGLTLDLPADGRVEGTIVTTVFGVQKGCSIVRVHDVKENVRAVKMTEAILRSGQEA